MSKGWLVTCLLSIVVLGSGCGKGGIDSILNRGNVGTSGNSQPNQNVNPFQLSTRSNNQGLLSRRTLILEGTKRHQRRFEQRLPNISQSIKSKGTQLPSWCENPFSSQRGNKNSYQYEFSYKSSKPLNYHCTRLFNNNWPLTSINSGVMDVDPVKLGNKWMAYFNKQQSKVINGSIGKELRPVGQNPFSGYYFIKVSKGSFQDIHSSSFNIVYGLLGDRYLVHLKPSQGAQGSNEFLLEGDVYLYNQNAGYKEHVKTFQMVVGEGGKGVLVSDPNGARVRFASAPGFQTDLENDIPINMLMLGIENGDTILLVRLNREGWLRN